MKSWRCDLCPVTGSEATAKAARGAYERHFYTVHYGKDADR